MSRVALVTGGAMGIGAAVARALAARGDSVVVADVDTAGGKAVADEVGGVFVEVDVRDPEASKRAVAVAEEHYGRLDWAHLNAGIAVDEERVEDVPLETYRRMLGINVDGVWFGLQAVLPAMRRAGGGSVVATASLAGLVPTPDTPIYGLTKHAVVGLVRSVAPRLAEDGITVAAVCPGFAETAILGHMAEGFHAADFPLLTPEEVAEVVLRAADDEPGAAWFIQPGVPPAPFRFRGVPGARSASGEPTAPPARSQR